MKQAPIQEEISEEISDEQMTQTLTEQAMELADSIETKRQKSMALSKKNIPVYRFGSREYFQAITDMVAHLDPMTRQEAVRAATKRVKKHYGMLNKYDGSGRLKAAQD